MDLYNIGAVMNAMVEMYRVSSRNTGRSSLLFSMVQDGDRIIFHNTEHANIAKRELSSRGKTDVQCISIDPRHLHEVIDKFKGTRRRTFYDHIFVEEYYQHIIRGAGTDLDRIQEILSCDAPARLQTTNGGARLS